MTKRVFEAENALLAAPPRTADVDNGRRATAPQRDRSDRRCARPESPGAFV